MMNVTCAILAGGFSTRIGQDKATLIINGKPLMNHVYERVQTIFNDIVIVSSNHSGFKYIDAPVIKDILPIKSPMVGIVSALVYSHNPYVYVCACDMPYLNEDAIRYIIESIDGKDIIIPKTNKGFEPLSAIYNRACISCMFTLIEHNKLKISKVFPGLTMNILGDNPIFYNKGRSVFTNINTLEDLETVKNDIIHQKENLRA